MGGFCHPQLTMQLHHIVLLKLAPHLEHLSQPWMTIHGSSVSPSVEKPQVDHESSRVLRKQK